MLDEIYIHSIKYLLHNSVIENWQQWASDVLLDTIPAFPTELVNNFASENDVIQSTAILPNFNECDHCKLGISRKCKVVRLMCLALLFVMDHIDVFPRTTSTQCKNTFCLGRLEARRTPIGESLSRQFVALISSC